MLVQHRFPLLLRKLDPETSISTPVPTRLFHRGSDYSHPRNLYSHARNPYSHPPGIFIHIAPESVFTCPGIRNAGYEWAQTNNPGSCGLVVEGPTRLLKAVKNTRGKNPTTRIAKPRRKSSYRARRKAGQSSLGIAFRIAYILIAAHVATLVTDVESCRVRHHAGGSHTARRLGHTSNRRRSRYEASNRQQLHDGCEDW